MAPQCLSFGAQRALEIVKRIQDQAAWEAEHGIEADPEVFQREILPHLQRITLGAIASATDLSVQCCSVIRRGRYVPHSRHWAAIAGFKRTV